MMLLLYILTVTRVIANGAADNKFEKLQIGDQCNITNTLFGQCMLFQQCNTSFKEKTNFPLCGFLEFEPIICCPLFNSRTNTLPGQQSRATSGNTSGDTSGATNSNTRGNTNDNTNAIKSSALIEVNPCNTANETCTLYSECTNVANLLWKGVAPTICGYQGNEHLICCPSNKQDLPKYNPHYCNSTEVCRFYSQCNTVKHELLSKENPVVSCGYKEEHLICCPIWKNEKYSSTANPNFCKYMEETCKLHSECDTINNVLSQNISLTTCGYQGHEKLICCPVRKSEIFCFKLYWHPAPTWMYYPESNNTYGVLAYGGEKSLAGEFPHMAILGYGTKEQIKWGCGGSLISTRHVLTAAHCLWSRELGDVKFIRLGDLNLAINTDLAAPQDFTVVNKIRHPNYRPPSKYFDIAILELDRDYKSSDYVKPACLQNKMAIQKTKFKATGWGRLEFDGEMADHLQVVILNNIDNAQCNNDYKFEDRKKLPMGIVQDLQICAANLTADTCPGDSGGPLQIRLAIRQCWLVCGVTSFGKPCGISKSAGVYTRVSNYIDWIESIVWS